MFQNSTIVAEFADITHVMWSMGWDEKNGGNISAILTEDQLSQVEQVASPRFVPLEHVLFTCLFHFLVVGHTCTIEYIEEPSPQDEE